MARDLERVKEVLWEQFEQAVKRQPEYGDYASLSAANPTNLSILGRQSIGVLGQALATVEHEIAVQKAYEDWRASGARIDDEIAGGIVRDVKALAKLKIKPAGSGDGTP